MTQHIPVIETGKFYNKDLKMRGSVYHQTANLVKLIFVKRAKKEERIDQNMITINV